MKNLLEELDKNPKLKAKMEELDKNPKSVPEDYIKAAAEYGIELKEEDFQPVKGQGEVTDDELDAVAGGQWCGCAFGGGGSAGKFDEVCACVMGGGGEYSQEAARYGKTGARCACVIGGCGDGSDR